MTDPKRHFGRTKDYFVELFTHRERNRLSEENKKLEVEIQGYKERENNYFIERRSLDAKVGELEGTILQSNELLGLYQQEQEELKKRFRDLKERYDLKSSSEAQAFGKLSTKVQRALLACLPGYLSIEPTKKINLNTTHRGSRCESRCYLTLLDRLSHVEYINRIDDIEAVQSRQSHVKPNHEYIEVVYKAPDRPGGCYKFRVYTHGNKKELVTEMIRQLVG